MLLRIERIRMNKPTCFLSMLRRFSRSTNISARSFVLLLPLGIWAQSSGGLVVGNTDKQALIYVSPGHVTTLVLTAVQTVLPIDSNTGVARVDASTIPLPTMLAGFSAVIAQQPDGYMASLPILRVRQKGLCNSQSQPPECLLTELTVQIPGDVRPNRYPVGPGIFTFIRVAENGHTLSDVGIFVHATTVHILTTCDTVVRDGPDPFCNPLITHADGTLVGPFSGPAAVPAQPGETLTLYAFGLGTTTPFVPPGTASPNPPAVADRRFSLIFNFGCPTKQTGTPVFVGLTPGQVGLFQVNFVVPEPAKCTEPPISNDTGGNLTLLSDDWISSDTVALYLR